MSDDIRKVLDQFGQNTQAALIGLALAMVKDEEERTKDKNPPEPSPAQQLVDLANSLPRELYDGEKFVFEDCGETLIKRTDNNGDGVLCHFNIDDFRRWLLGVMSAFVGTEVRAVVMRIGGNSAQYRVDQDSHYIEVDGPDAWLLAHRDCCLAIAEKRRAKA